MIIANGGTLRASLVAAALACLVADGACAQQNPFQTLTDALNKTKQQRHRRHQPIRHRSQQCVPRKALSAGTHD
ncbi:MAG TPA: hypothetical protein VHX52_10455 [Steroidobacteraceae bacterium]|jgi:hypothetical protein|nr:hypothetical protein [Steroidobacteraceae bacterium]